MSEQATWLSKAERIGGGIEGGVGEQATCLSKLRGRVGGFSGGVDGMSLLGWVLIYSY